VFSVAATYVVLGSQGVIIYHKLRQKANAERRGGLLSDSFHDGTNVLPEVVTWHKYLRSTARRTDVLTEEILNVVEKHVLLDDADRVDSGYLCKVLTDTLEKRDSTPEILSTDLIKLLEYIDDLEEADSRKTPRSSDYGAVENIRDNSCNTYTTPLPNSVGVSFKSKHELLSQSVRPTIQRTQRRQARESNSIRQSQVFEGPYHTPPNANRSMESLMPPYTPSAVALNAMEHTKMKNIYQVSSELKDLQKASTLSSFFGIRRAKSVKKTKQQSHKDELGEFYDNRDIVSVA
jgi:hypothetical protein